MRAFLVFVLVAVPSVAAAKPQLKCEFEGNKGVVTIVNPDAKRQHCSYACHFTLENGAGSAVGSIGVAAGETKKVSERTYTSKVSRVRDSSLECE